MICCLVVFTVLLRCSDCGYERYIIMIKKFISRLLFGLLLVLAVSAVSMAQANNPGNPGRGNGWGNGRGNGGGNGWGNGRGNGRGNGPPVSAPEPTTLALIGVGAAGVAGGYLHRRRRKNKNNPYTATRQEGDTQ